MIQNKVVRSKDLVVAFAVGVLLRGIIQSCVPLLKWQKQERMMKMTKNDFLGRYRLLKKLKKTHKKLRFFFAFFSRAFFWRLRGMYSIPFSSPRKEEIKCHVVLTHHTAKNKRNEKTTTT